MGQVRRALIGVLLATSMIPAAAISAQNNYEIDLKDLRPAGTIVKPQKPPQPASATSLEIDLKELRRVAPHLPAKQPQRKRHNNPVATKIATPTPTASEHESIHVVRSGEFLFQILMKHYGLSEPVAERLIPEVMRLNGITSPKSLKVGQRLRIPLPAGDGKLTTLPPVSVKKSGQAKLKTEQDSVPPPLTKSTAPLSELDSISVISASPCKLAHDISEKMGLLAPTHINIHGVETVNAVYAGRGVTVACGLSLAEQYTYERLLAHYGNHLLFFDADVSDERVVDKLSNYLGLTFRKSDPNTEVPPLTYIFAPFGSRTEELRLTILPASTATVLPPQ